MLTPDKVIHIYPIDEENEHVIFLTYPVLGDPYSECKCEPWFKPAENGCTLVIHASFNGREGLEWANDILNSNK